ncbi:hypothetical protein Trco_006772, partial [Trichoderma cornu-damae]
MTKESPNNNDEAPPTYASEASAVQDGFADPARDIDVTASFANLSLSSGPPTGGPNVDTCLAHLKLLHAIHSLKEDVGYTDGLWGIWDSRAQWDTAILDSEALPPGIRLEGLDEGERVKLALSRLREKRWAIFLARAVDRYEAWWNAVRKHETMLTEEDMMRPKNPKYTRFVTTGTPLPWKDELLPPLDVLMVMHAHMLNPRAFLEDTMRAGLIEHWTAGMPWHVVNNAISTDFTYSACDEAKASWASRTERSWANQDDSMVKLLKCPWCKADMRVPWTTCGTDENGDKSTSGTVGTIGSGYGDGSFSHQCPACNKTVNKELLSLSKFVQDSVLLLGKSIPMPGTILDPTSGKPATVPQPPVVPMCPRTFPNRMIQHELRIKIVDLIGPKSSGSRPPTIANVRDLVEKTLANGQTVRRIDGVTNRTGRYPVQREARIATRKMMSRYWENFSPFALDLCGAVMRQGVFIDKMVKLDWLHSPSAKATMSRLVTKYGRFVALMKKHPQRMVVPTLDVDLAWHTHQLTPNDYYAYTVKTTGKFIDHDDKIEENKLSEAFEWTTKIYQESYGEVYSECTCWYCETIRSSQGSRIGRLLNVSSGQRLADSFHTSGTANLCPPDNSAHISAHNSVKTLETPARAGFAAYVRARQALRLEEAYRKASKRAEKKGRTLPPKDQYYDHWGYSYYMYGPFMYPVYFAPGMYYGWDPCYVPSGTGAWANCAGGTCGNGSIAAGGCGGPGGCSVGAASQVEEEEEEEEEEEDAVVEDAAAVEGEEEEDAEEVVAVEEVVADEDEYQFLLFD